MKAVDAPANAHEAVTQKPTSRDCERARHGVARLQVDDVYNKIPFQVRTKEIYYNTNGL